MTMTALWSGTPQNFGIGARLVDDEWIMSARTIRAAVRSDPIRSEEVLDWLCEVFPRFSGPFSEIEVEECEVDFHRWGMPLALRRHGLRIDVLVEGHPAQIERVESVLIVEALLTLGEIMVVIGVGSDATARWETVKDSCLLFAAPPEDGTFDVSSEELDRQARWSAKGLGHSIEDYVLAAQWLTSRQRLFAVGQLDNEPSPDEWAVRTIPALPSPEVIKDMLEKAAAAFDETVEDVCEEALALRNMDARQVLVFRRFYGPVRA
jgi:hypothetical protein